jgi:hypothetical protein
MLTITHLRFDLIARDPVRLNRHMAGDYLRNGLASVMLRATCSETHRTSKPAPEHAAVCPACWLLAAEVDPGSVVRAYSLAPPLPPRDLVESGEPFAFVLTLFGDGFQFLPYFVLAIAELGRLGVGVGRGKFDLRQITAVNPLRSLCEIVKQPDDPLVKVPTLHVAWPDVVAAADQLEQRLSDGELRLRFHTPTRLIENGRKLPLKSPDFGVFFQRLLYRLDDLGRQFAGQERRPSDEVAALHQLANQVRLVESQTRWIELWNWSGRKQSKTPIGGFVGAAHYTARSWTELLPWLVWGQAAQVGKMSIKGNGVYSVEAAGWTNYWDLIFQPAPAQNQVAPP